ncbi:MAG: hypothetical protein Q4G09_07955 [Clostridia bacterium]|nr:hypothetical protein [Clostridia bacterium]
MRLEEYFTNDFIDEINKCLRETISQKQEKSYIDYNILEEYLKNVLNYQKNYRRKNKIPKIVAPIQRERAIQISLEFFKSVDEEFYKKALAILTQQTPNISTYIYNINNIQNYEEKNEYGINKYSQEPSVISDRGQSVVHIPIDGNVCEISDVYNIIHEIAHTFDFTLTDTAVHQLGITTGNPNIINRFNKTRDLLGESTAIGFEYMLSDFLQKRDKVFQRFTDYEKDKRMSSSAWHARNASCQLLLARLIESNKTGRVEYKDIEKIVNDYNISPKDAYYITKDSIGTNMMFESRYAISYFIAPVIAQKDTISIKKYLERVKKDDFKGAMDILGTETVGIKKLISMNKEKNVYQEGITK